MVRDRSIKLNVAAVVRHLEQLEKGQTSWWCSQRGAATGDILVVYKKQYGIRWVLEVRSATPERGSWCGSFGMDKAKVRALEVGNAPITLREIRENEVLSSMGALRRNFQGKLFNLTEEQLKEILRLLKKSRKSG